jgi:hypothetical protein
LTVLLGRIFSGLLLLYIFTLIAKVTNGISVNNMLNCGLVDFVTRHCEPI